MLLPHASAAAAPAWFIPLLLQAPASPHLQLSFSIPCIHLHGLPLPLLMPPHLLRPRLRPPQSPAARRCPSLRSLGGSSASWAPLGCCRLGDVLCACCLKPAVVLPRGHGNCWAPVLASTWKLVPTQCAPLCGVVERGRAGPVWATYALLGEATARHHASKPPTPTLPPAGCDGDVHDAHAALRGAAHVGVRVGSAPHRGAAWHHLWVSAGPVAMPH